MHQQWMLWINVDYSLSGIMLVVFGILFKAGKCELDKVLYGHVGN